MVADDSSQLDIAIIGMAGRFPAAPTVDALWQRLLAGEECLSAFTDAELAAAGVSVDDRADPAYVKAGGVLSDVDQFDAAFFGYSPREAALIDPQHRLFLEAAWTALEHAGHAAGAIRGRVGVYGGVGLNDYLLKHVLPAVGVLDHPVALANDKDFLATRVSYKLNLEGPSVVVQTACSTSLVAVHLACQALLAGDCDFALAGGVTIRLPQHAGYRYEEGGITSPDGHCRTFSANAQGTVPGNGGAVVVLRRLVDARADRDSIIAVIKGSAINNDGADKIGYTAPRVDGQAQVIRSALAAAGVSAADIGYLEAHGTGTALGDPIEIAAAVKAFRQDTDAIGTCAIGAVKSNVGHLDVAAGVTGLIKAALAVRDGVIPASLHFDRPNPRIDFAGSPFVVAAERRAWRHAVRRAGVSSFGMGGTNAHVILEQAQSPEPSTRLGVEVLTVSAKSQAALDQSVAALADHLEQQPNLHLSDVGFTLRHGRAAFPFRRAVVARDVRGAIDRLRVPVPTLPAATGEARVVWMFPGQGSQHAGLGRELYASEPVFRRHVDHMAARLIPEVGFDLRDAIHAPDDASDMSETLRDTRIAQPAIFVVSYAMAQLLLSWGVSPAAMIGHSIGEYVAACLAGVFAVDDVLALVAERGRLMSAMAPGSMLAVPQSPNAVLEDLPATLALAAVNAPALSVVAGPSSDVDRYHRWLGERGIEARPLHTSHAFHSPMMDEILPAFQTAVGRVARHEPSRPFVSNVTGTWITASEATDPAYWARHLRGTVRFSMGLETVLASSPSLCLEVGPGQTLTALALRHGKADRRVAAAATMRRADATSASDAMIAREALGALWVAGVPIDWAVADAGTDARRVPLPTYPFQRQRYWIDAQERAEASPRRDTRANVGRSADWFSIPSWERLPRVAPARPTADAWLVFLDELGVGDALADRLRVAGQTVVTVRPGTSFSAVDERQFVIAPDDPADYVRLCGRLPRGRTLGVIHCWTVGGDQTARREPAAGGRFVERGFYSLLWLAQAIGGDAYFARGHVTVMSTGVHEVVGGEPRCPEKALVLGPCRVLPIELDGWTCTHIDVTKDEATSSDTMAAVLATMARPPAPVVAIRGATRWQQTVVPLPIDPLDAASPFVEQGVYLITGGLGGVGLEVARHLASTVHARLVLVSRSGLPVGVEQAGDARLDAGAAIADLSRQESAIAAGVSLAPMSQLDGLEATLDSLSCEIVLGVLESAGFDLSTSWVEARTALRRRCGILPRFDRLFDRMLEMLVEDGWAVPEGDAIRFVPQRRSRMSERLEHARARYPQLSDVLALIDSVGAAYASALDGRIPALELLFGEGHHDGFARAIDAVRRHSHLPLCEALVGAVVTTIAGQTRGQPIRLLEIGGGEGRLTRVLLPLLDGRDVEYQFTDISRSFVLQAERDAARQGRRWMRFAELDVSRSPVDQGFSPESVDVALAFNVLHATPDVAQSLAHASALLAPGGLLILQEAVRAARWVDLVWGLTDGWFAFTDEPLRQRSPLLTLEAWRETLERSGFTMVTTYPQQESVRQYADTGVILARKSSAARETASHAAAQGTAAGETLAVVAALERLGAEVTVRTADVADRDRMQQIVEETVRRYGRINGVIHAALVLDDGAMQLKQRAAVERVFAPKVAGTLVLEQVLRERGLDFLAVFSSLVSVLGGAGQVDYCAASNFQDAWVRTVPPTTARRVVSIDWGAWRETGKAYRAALARGGSVETILPDGMSSADGVDAFVRALSAVEPQILVAPNVQALTAPPARVSAPLSEPIDHADPHAPPASSPAAGSLSGAPRNDVEQRIAALWAEVLGVGHVGIDDNFFDLGGDSLIGLQFIAKAKKVGLRVTNRQIFEHQTVATLAAALAASSGPDTA